MCAFVQYFVDDVCVSVLFSLVFRRCLIHAARSSFRSFCHNRARVLYVRLQETVFVRSVCFAVAKS